MTLTSLLLTIQTASRRYLIRREQLSGLYAIVGDLPAPGGRPITYRDLGPLLDPDEQPGAGRRHVLLVELRRRTVGLIVERVDALIDLPASAVRPLAPLIARHLARPWVEGVLVQEDQPLLLLDLHRIARDVALGAV